MPDERFDHEALKASVAAFSIGALEEEEREEVLRHLETCDECRADFEALAEVASWLALIHEPPPLPSGFQERVLTEARRRRAGEIISVASPARPRTRWLLGAAATVAFIAVGTWLALNLATGDVPERQRAALEALVESDRQIQLRGTTSAVASVVPNEDGAVFIATDLSPAPSESVYQLWLKQGGRIVSAGVFEPTDGIAIVEIDEPFHELDGALVTIEPPGGSPQPTSTPVVDSI